MTGVFRKEENRNFTGFERTRRSFFYSTQHLMKTGFGRYTNTREVTV